jgi:hypothetical protein
MSPKVLLPVCVLLATLTFASGQAPAPAPEPVPAPTAQVAKIDLTGPTRAKVGELVVIDASASIANQWMWKTDLSAKHVLTIDDGRRLAFSVSQAGEYTFVLAVAYENTVDLQILKVTVTGGEGDIASKVVALCESLPQSETRKAEALKLAASFSTVASLVESGSIETPEAVLTATTQANRDALGSAKDSWAPFFAALQPELAKLASTGKLTDAQSHAPVWKSIAEGLKTYAAN